MKIKEILKDNNINEKKLALEQVLNLSIPEILLNKDKNLTKKEAKAYKKIEKKINKGLPIQYILKKASFYNKDFLVNKNVLIPRPETEYLVDEVIKQAKEKFKNKKISILDIGTGSGIIAITLNKLIKNSEVVATDVSRKALKVAKKNQKLHKTNVKFIKTDLYKNINQKFDIIISNPPYIEQNSQNIEQKVKKHEPHLALYGGEDGLKCYREIIENIKTILKEDHIIAFEIGENQSEQLKKMITRKLTEDKVIIKKDYNDYDRYLIIYSENIDK